MSALSSHLHHLIDYTYWADGHIATAFPADPAPYARLYNHIIVVQQLWLDRMHQQPARYGPWDTLDSKEWAAFRQSTYRQLLATAQPKLWDTPYTYTNTAGSTFTGNIAETLFHVINHSTHHRSQIALLLRQHDISPPQTDYIFYARNNR